MTLRRTRILMWASVICLSVAASISGITNGFAFDDFSIIVRNSRTHSLAHWWHLFAQSYWPQIYGGDLYRPVTMVGFAIQWALGGGAPLVFHAVSVGLYSLVCAAFLAVLLELLPVGAAWLGAAVTRAATEPPARLVPSSQVFGSSFAVSAGSFLVAHIGTLSKPGRRFLGSIFVSH